VPTSSHFLRLLGCFLAIQSAPLAAQSRVSAPLRPGDRVLVSNPADSSRREEFEIDGAGRVFLPRVGAVQVTSYAATDVADSIRARYRRIQRVDDVYVQVFRRISLLGELRAPGIYLIEPSLTLRDAVAKAGGVSEIGVSCCLEIVRGGARIALREWRWMPDTSLVLESGDVIVVEREPWLKRNLLATISGVAVLLSTVALLAR
jgi:polysaccharide export outer membrane protein